jgi:hypothetical protein
MDFYNRVSAFHFSAVIQHSGGAFVVPNVEANDAAIIGFQGPDVIDYSQKSVRHRPKYQDKPGWHTFQHQLSP